MDIFFILFLFFISLFHFLRVKFVNFDDEIFSKFPSLFPMEFFYFRRWNFFWISFFLFFFYFLSSNTCLHFIAFTIIITIIFAEVSRKLSISLSGNNYFPVTLKYDCQYATEKANDTIVGTIIHVHPLFRLAIACFPLFSLYRHQRVFFE